MRPADFYDLFDQWKKKEQRSDQRVALLCAQLSNSVLAAAGGKAQFKVEDFLAGGGSRKMDGAEMLVRARALFPPKQDDSAT